MTTPHDDRDGAELIHGLDHRSLLRWMIEAGLPVDPTESLGVELLMGGRSNVTYRIHQGDASWVVRRPPFGHVMPSAHDMAREFRVISGMAAAGVPVPTPLALCEDTSVIGATFQVMEFVSGRVMSSADDVADLTPAQAGSLSQELITVLADIHSVDAGAVGLEGLGKPEGFLPRQARRWRQQWELSKTRELPELESLADWIDQRVAALPETMPWSVVHGDFRLDNTIVDPDSLRISAVVDWEMSTLGDPLTDLALYLVYWTRPDDGLLREVPLTGSINNSPGFWSREDIANEYANRTGSDLGHLDVCLALSTFKLAVILESIRKRSLSGHQMGTAAQESDVMLTATNALIRLGLAVAEGGGISALSR